jgi:Flp pilus assembly protein TadG
MKHSMKQRRRDERGAVAVMVGLLSVVLLSMAAMGVDLGNAWAQKRQVQAGSDLAAEAGAGIKGANLPATTVHSCSYGNAGAVSTDQSVKDISTYLANQAYPTATGATYSSYLANLPAQLTDCNMANGEVVYGTPNFTAGAWSVAFNKNQLSLVSPPKHVDFGLAGVMGFSGTNVNGVSTVEIRSPKFGALPFYAFSGCDYGPQTLQQPNNGHSTDPVLLYAPTDNASATLTSITPASYPVDSTGTVVEPLTIKGSGFANVTQVGFFEPGNSVAGPAPVTIDNATTVKFTINGAGTQITIPDIPDQTRGVAGVQEFWYLRVMKGGKWSTYTVDNNGNVQNSPVLTIGTPPLLCGQGSSQGNFGTLLLAHAGYNGADKVGAANVALGLTNSLSIYPTGGPADGTCSSAQTQTVLWNTDGTNCVDTDTGMSANVATGGFLGLGSSAPGGNQYLLKPNGKTKCGTGGTEATTVVKGQTVNNDVLTCFFLDSTTNVADVDSGGYSGTPLISNAIYDSPRFAYVPVLKVQPANGGSNKYQIIDFRACFITDQPGSAVKGDQPSATNGLITDNNGITSVQVIFLNPNALPNPPVKNGTINYIGSGAKIPLLVN